jgi:SAM-dependent methyltransferase
MAQERRYVKKEGAPLMTTTLWDYRSQNYPGGRQGNPDFAGATPSYIIWNLLQRYTKPKWLVVDPMAGSGTTLDVARDLSRRALGYDLEPTRKDIFRADARRLPLESGKADFVFVDPPYSTHLKYSEKEECIGELDARTSPQYYAAMESVMAEIHRILRRDRYMALYVSDSARKGKSFVPLGFELFHRLRRHFTPVDIVAVVRHNRSLKRNHWHESAAEGGYFLRGFNYLLIMKKELGARKKASGAQRSASNVSSSKRKPGKRGQTSTRGKSRTKSKAKTLKS